MAGHGGPHLKSQPEEAKAAGSFLNWRPDLMAVSIKRKKKVEVGKL
jgi:hypothetical protein